MTQFFSSRRVAILESAILLIVAILISVSGCGSKSPQRTIADIEFELDNLPAIYVTETSGKQILTSSSHGLAFHDSDSGEIAWIAYTCENPNCPAKGTGKGDRPPLFIWRDPTATAQPDGTVSFQRIPPNGESYKDYIEKLGGQIEPICPACLEQRNLKSETADRRQKYTDWVKRYVPPEAAQKAAELRAEKAQWLKNLEERKAKKMPNKE